VQGAGVSTSVTAILFDALDTKSMDQAYACGQLLKFLRLLQPDDHIAVYRMGRDGIRILHDVTDDADHLRSVLEKLKAVQEAGRLGPASDPFEIEGLQFPGPTNDSGRNCFD
jgi:hypothetical protein